MVICSGWSVKEVAVGVALYPFFYALFMHCRKRFRGEKPGKKQAFRTWLGQPFSGVKGPAAFVTVLTVLFWLAQGRLPLWANTDDYWISCVLNGIYSSENYCVFVNPILAKIVKLIDVIFPNADGFVLLGEVLGLMGVWCVFYILSKAMSRGNVLLAWLFLIFFNDTVNLLHLPFTSFTCLLAVMGVFLCYAVLHQKANKAFALVGIIFIVFACLWRYEAFLMCLPFFAVMIGWDVVLLVKAPKREVLSYLRRLAFIALPAVVLCVVSVEIKNETDQSPGYAEGIAYNAARASMVDYSLLGWEEVGEQLQELGVSENDYKMLRKMILADTEIIDTEYIRSIAGISYKASEEKLQDYITVGLVQQFISLAYTTPVFFVQVILQMILLVWFLTSDLNIYKKLGLACCYLGAFIIGSYFTYKGHMMYYVTQALILAVWGAVASFALLEDGVTKKVPTVEIIVFNAVVALLMGILYYGGGSYSSNLFASLEAKTSQISDIVGLDESDDTVYIWSVYNFNSVMRTSEQFCGQKLLSEEFVAHNLVDGEWEYSQPYYVDYLHNIGLDNPMQALLNREHTYYVAPEERCQMVLTFLQEHYDSSVVVESVGEIKGIPVWKFSAAQ
jgi:hypothetical protein